MSYDREKRTPRDPMADQLRRAVRASGRSTSHLARDAGLDRRGLGKFLEGTNRECHVGTAEAIAEALGLKLTLGSGKRKGGGS